jgi:SAM-dependent methyltransferase/uncharacterized protein YbaR (Trm112 family)
MWKRFGARLVCPLTQSPLELIPFETRRAQLARHHYDTAEAGHIATDVQFSTVVESGVLCAESKWMYPIVHGVPILLPYTTPLHRHFRRIAAADLSRFNGLRFPEETPMPGERAVSRSFSKEWMGYEYDGVLWDLSYDDNRRRLLAEIGEPAAMWKNRSFLEVGCGIGVTTAQAQELSGTDAIGVDLSVAVLKAARQFAHNPFLHFAQASAFALPFSVASFDMLYTRGVLHHTYSTRQALMSVATLCREGGLLYAWIYGPDSIQSGTATARNVRVGGNVAPDSEPAVTFDSNHRTHTGGCCVCAVQPAPPSPGTPRAAVHFSSGASCRA